MSDFIKYLYIALTVCVFSRPLFPDREIYPYSAV